MRRIDRKEEAMKSFNWTCPHCEQHVTIVEGRLQRDSHVLYIKNRIGLHALVSEFIVCPNPACEKYILTVLLFDTTLPPGVTGGRREIAERLATWRLVPWGASRTFPDYVPAPIREDYEEACSIVELSPKAAATLARRAVQGIIRGYWKISKATLNQELLELANYIGATVTQETWDSIDAVRSIGNIGAHMEKDINIIVDVDRDEAQLLIGLIETLIEDTYIATYDRQQRNLKLKALKAEKEVAKKPPQQACP